MAEQISSGTLITSIINKLSPSPVNNLFDLDFIKSLTPPISLSEQGEFGSVENFRKEFIRFCLTLYWLCFFGEESIDGLMTKIEIRRFMQFVVKEIDMVWGFCFCIPLGEGFSHHAYVYLLKQIVLWAVVYTREKKEDFSISKKELILLLDMNLSGRSIEEIRGQDTVQSGRESEDGDFSAQTEEIVQSGNGSGDADLIANTEAILDDDCTGPIFKCYGCNRVSSNVELAGCNFCDHYYTIEQEPHTFRPELVKKQNIRILHHWLFVDFFADRGDMQDFRDRAALERASLYKEMKLQEESLLDFWEWRVQKFKMLTGDPSVAHCLVVLADEIPKDKYCPICLEYFNSSLQEVRKLPCGHFMHCDCLKSQLKYQNSLCAFCREPVPLLIYIWSKQS